MQALTSLRFLLIPALLLAAFSARAQLNKKELREAEEHMRSQDFRAAMPIWESLKKQDADNPNVNFQLGMCYLQVGRGGEAFPLLIQAREYYTEDPRLTRYIAESQHIAYRFDEAIASYEDYLGTIEKKNIDEKMDIERRITQCHAGRRMVQTESRAKIENIGEPVNSRFREYAPVITADNSRMYFTSRRDGSTGGDLTSQGEFYEDVYSTDRRGAGWSMPANIGPPINSKSHDCAIGLSPDGQQMFFRKDEGFGDIYISNLQGNKWSKPKPLPGRVNAKDSDELSCSITADGRILYFSSNRPGGKGGWDIWKSLRQPDGKWSEPENLGEPINTPLDEDAPFIHPDGVSLYFSSKGLDGMGGYDIFRTILENGLWTEPENLGHPINTPGNDIYFVLAADSRNGYYSSERAGGQGALDIYRISMPPPGDESEVVARQGNALAAAPSGAPGQPDSARVKQIRMVPSSPMQSAIAVMLVKGAIRDKQEGKPIAARVQVVDNTSGEIVSDQESNSETGQYLVVLPQGKNYGLSVVAQGYLFHSENFFLPESREYKEFEKNVDLNRASKGTKVVLRNIFFDTDKATLRKESITELEKLLRLLNEMEDLKLEISGHTDNVGSADHNQKLSESRAKAVVDYLIGKGVPKTRLTYAGYGFERPIAENDTEAHKQLNRRTEFEVK